MFPHLSETQWPVRSNARLVLWRFSVSHWVGWLNCRLSTVIRIRRLPHDYRACPRTGTLFGIGVKTQPAIQTTGGSGFASTNFSISGCLPLPERSREMHFSDEPFCAKSVFGRAYGLPRMNSNLDAIR